MNTEPKISILVPCYNVEKYLEECMDSIVSQTLKDIEIICLNDGSTDRTLDILKRYAAKDERIVIIDKPNSGYGATMNIGLDTAKGQYIGIVESDDYIEADMFEELYNAAEKHGLDMVRCLYTIHDEVKHKEYIKNDPSLFGCDSIFCPGEQKNIFLIGPSIWVGIYKKEMLDGNDIRFLETPGASYQDVAFTFKTFASSKRMMVLSKALHHYRINSSSSVSSTGKVFCVCDEEAEIRRYAKDHGLYEEFKELMAFRALRSYKWNYKRLSFPLKRQFIRQWSKEAKAMFEDGEITGKYFSRSRRLRLWIIAHCPWMYYFRKKF